MGSKSPQIVFRGTSASPNTHKHTRTHTHARYADDSGSGPSLHQTVSRRSQTVYVSYAVRGYLCCPQTRRGIVRQRERNSPSLVAIYTNRLTNITMYACFYYLQLSQCRDTWSRDCYHFFSCTWFHYHSEVAVQPEAGCRVHAPLLHFHGKAKEGQNTRNATTTGHALPAQSLGAANPQLPESQCVDINSNKRPALCSGYTQALLEYGESPCIKCPHKPGERTPYLRNHWVVEQRFKTEPPWMASDGVGACA